MSTGRNARRRRALRGCCCLSLSSRRSSRGRSVISRSWRRSCMRRILSPPPAWGQVCSGCSGAFLKSSSLPIRWRRMCRRCLPIIRNIPASRCWWVRFYIARRFMRIFPATWILSAAFARSGASSWRRISSGPIFPNLLPNTGGGGISRWGSGSRPISITLSRCPTLPAMPVSAGKSALVAPSAKRFRRRSPF